MEASDTPSAAPQGGWWFATFVIGVAALIVATIGVVGAFGRHSSAVDATPTTVIEVQLADLYITPSSIDVAAGTTVQLHVRNAGAMAHDLKVDGTSGTQLLAPGSDETITIGPFQASTEAWCTIAGHKQAGMVMKITVTGGAAAGDHDGAASASSTGAADAASDPATASATLDPAAVPAADWESRDPVLPPRASGTVHEIAFDATEKLIEVAPGVTQMMWTFNDQVPGPMLHGKIGDTFRITLANKGTLGHSIDFHASKVAWSDEMRTIQPGESLVYEFNADYAGAFMYHCGTAPALHHIGNGMYGAIIIDPPDLAKVDKEFVMIQSELYFGPLGQPGDLTKMVDNNWDAVVFNGYHNQYKHRPLHVEANKRYRMWVVDDGPNENSAFHIVGTIFDTVFKEGAYQLQPDDTHGGSQVLDLQPAQGGFVEFSFAEDGLYPFVTHKFSNVGKGALGFFAVGDVDTSALGGH